MHSQDQMMEGKHMTSAGLVNVIRYYFKGAAKKTPWWCAEARFLALMIAFAWDGWEGRSLLRDNLQGFPATAGCHLSHRLHLHNQVTTNHDEGGESIAKFLNIYRSHIWFRPKYASVYSSLTPIDLISSRTVAISSSANITWTALRTGLWSSYECKRHFPSFSAPSFVLLTIIMALLALWGSGISWLSILQEHSFQPRRLHGFRTVLSRVQLQRSYRAAQLRRLRLLSEQDALR